MAHSISLDFETYNTLDLRKTGAEIYAASQTLEVTAVAWAIDDGPVESQARPPGVPLDVLAALAAGYKLRAWNAAFEWLILKHHYKVEIPWEQVRCTMQRALYAGLPGRLDKAGQALGLPLAHLKDVSARNLMMAMARPRAGGGKWHVDDPQRLARLEAYCRQDVVAEREVGKRIPFLPRSERRISQLDHATNQRGLALDLGLVSALSRLAYEETHRLEQACGLLTDGEVTAPGGQVAKLKAWLAGQGVAVTAGTSLDKGGVDKLLKSKKLTDPAVRQVLEIRQDIALSSTKKLQAMTVVAGADGRVRGQLAYYGAGRTGRWSGRLIQPQNMPRSTLPKPILRQAIKDIGRGAGAEWIDAVYGAPLSIVAQALRSCIVPGPGKRFVIYDFKQIEARVISWLAGQQDALASFARDEDPYVRAQTRMGLASRLHGKVVVLACGFGMGPKKFVDTARKYGLAVDLTAAHRLVHGWRDANPEITGLWQNTEAAARRALGVDFPAPVPVKGTSGKLRFQAVIGHDYKVVLRLKLPSGRELFYRDAEIFDAKAQPVAGRTLPAGIRDGELIYDGLDQATHQWGTARTWGGKLVENCLGGDTRVLTERGWLKITKVTTRDMLWDGLEWVGHTGLIHQGDQPCLNFHGVHMTPDHEVLTEDGWKPAQAYPRPDRQNIRLPDGRDLCRTASATQRDPVALPLYLWNGSDPSRPCPDRYGQAGLHTIVPELQAPPGWPNQEHARHVETSRLRGMVLDAGTLPRFTASGVEELRGPRDHGMPAMADIIQGILARHGADLASRTRTGPTRQQRQLRARELPLGDANCQHQQHPASVASDRHGKVGADDRHQAAHPVYPLVSRPVYDIRNAGPRSRFMVLGDDGPFIVHNCVQAIARDILADAMARVDEQGLGELVASVHDEAIFEIPDSEPERSLTIRTEIERSPAFAPDLPVGAEGGLRSSYGV